MRFRYPRIAMTVVGMCAAVPSGRALAQSFSFTEGTAEAWDFADGLDFSDSTGVAGQTAFYAGVDTDGGLDDTFIRGTLVHAPGVIDLTLETAAGGNGRWSFVSTFLLDDPHGSGWFVEQSGGAASVIVLEPDLTSPTPGSLTDLNGELVASAGSYRLFVRDPNWQSYFRAPDDTWTQHQDYSLRLTVVPPPPSIAVALLGAAASFGIRRRR